MQRLRGLNRRMLHKADDSCDVEDKVVHLETLATCSWRNHKHVVASHGLVRVYPDMQKELIEMGADERLLLSRYSRLPNSQRLNAWNRLRHDQSAIPEAHQ